MAVKPIPAGYHTVTPYLAVRGADKVLDFVRKAFAAEIGECMRTPEGVLMHAQAKIGDSMVMLGEAPAAKEPMPAMLYLYVEDADAVYRRALAAGASSIQEPADQFYGDRHGAVRDGAGNQWWIATHKEDVPPKEMERRAQAAMRAKR